MKNLLRVFFIPYIVKFLALDGGVKRMTKNQFGVIISGIVQVEKSMQIIDTVDIIVV